MVEPSSSSAAPQANPPRRSFRFIGAVVLLIVVVGAGTWFAFFRGGNTTNISVTDYLPEDAQGAVIVQPTQILRSRIVAETVPGEVLQSFLERFKTGAWPLDLRKVEQIGLYWSPPYPGVPDRSVSYTPSYNMTGVVIFVNGIKAEEEVEKIPEFARKWSPLPVPSGKAWTTKLMDWEKQDLPIDAVLTLYTPSPRVLLLGCRGRVLAAGQSSGGAASTLKELLAQADLTHEFVFAGTELNEFKMPPWMAYQAGPASAFVATSMLVTYKQALLQIGVTPGGQLVDLAVEARDDAYAQQLEQQFEYSRQQLKTSIATFLPATPATGWNELVAEIEKGWKVSRNGNSVRLTVPLTDKLIDQIKVALQPSIKSAQAVAQRTESRNNLKQLALSTHNFTLSYQRLPPGQDAKADKRFQLGQPQQVSWLYDLLPFLEQTKLFKQIDPGKPWNDPANKTGGATILPAFTNPALKLELVEGAAPTHYVGNGGLGENGPNEPVTSPKAGVFGYNRKTTFGDVRDGMSNTFMATEAASDFGPWLANTRATIRPFTKKPYLHGPDGIGGAEKEGPTQFLMLDGSVRTLSPTTDPAIIEAQTTINGGENKGNPLRRLFKR